MKEYRRSDESYAALFRDESLGVFVMAQGVEECNDAACRLLGFSREELIGRSPLAFSPDVQPGGAPSPVEARERVEAALAGMPQWFEWEFRRADGESVATLVHVEAIRLDAATRVLVHVRDLTRLWRAEVSRRETEMQLQQILDHSTASLVWAKDLSGRYMFVNPAVQELTGRTRGEIIGRTDEELLPREVAERIRADDRRVLEERRAIEFEEAVELGGRQRTLLTSKFPLIGPDGAPYAVCGFATDITARKRAEERLQRAALAVSSAGGQKVFEELARSLATVLDVQAVLIAVFVDEERSRMRTLATYVDGRLLKIFEYELAGTPCKGVVGREFRYSPQGVHPEFRPGTMLSELGFDSYAAYSLNAAAGRQLGLIAAMDRRPMPDRELTEAMLKIFAVRASAELERSRAEEAVRASEEQYRAIFNASVDALVLWDSEVRRVDVNPAYERLFGFTREEVLAGAYPAHQPPEYAERRHALIRRTLAGEPCHAELEAVRKNGERFYVEVHTTPIRHRGEPHVLVVSRDITERKRAEEAVRASEEQYRAIFNASADALVLWNSELRRVDVNPAYERLFGFTREEILARDHTSHLPEEYVERRHELVRRTLAGEACHAELEAVRKNGERFFIEVRTIPIRHRGEPHVLAIVRDVTERKRTDEALRASEEQYRAIFNASVDALVLRDADFRIVDVNPAYEAMSGYVREEVLGALHLVANPVDLEADIRALHASALAGEPFRFECEGIRKDGSRFDVEVRGVPIRHQGRPHVLYIGRDITGQKQAEAERTQLEAQLRQAQKMEAIGHLTGGIAHDFNNILTSIMGYVALAVEREGAAGDPKLGHYLEQAMLSSRRARDLIQQMLTFSRGQRGERRPLDLRRVAAESARLLRSSLPATLELETVTDEAVPLASLDRVQAEQVLLNLCINARDAVGGQGRVRVRVGRSGRRGAVCASCRNRVHGEFVELEVSDDGPGIPPAVMERIFEPFFTTKEVGKGSGMGLATVHGIVHEHGGHVLVESRTGAGATFRVLFPVLRSAGADIEHETLPGYVPAARGTGLRGRVLLVDDEEMVVGFMRELLEGWGLRVTAKANGPDARAAFADEPEGYDLVITDQTMPRLTGLQLAGELMRIRPDVPIIMYTGYADDLTEAQATQAGVSALIRKPVEPAALLAVLKTHLPRGVGAGR